MTALADTLRLLADLGRGDAEKLHVQADALDNACFACELEESEATVSAMTREFSRARKLHNTVAPENLI